MIGDCPKCHEFMVIPDRHKCPPIFEVRRDEDGDEWEAIRAFDHESAAKKWGQWDDCESADYSIANGNEATVLVREVGSEDVKRFVVSGESTIVYSAREAK